MKRESIISVKISLTTAFLSVVLASCSRELMDDGRGLDLREKVQVSFTARGEMDSEDSGSKVILDFTQAANVRWQDSDQIAVFDGSAKNSFSILPGSNTGASATLTGDVTKGYSCLCAVYPYSAGVSRTGSNVSVTVPAAQTISGSEKADPAALVSVGCCGISGPMVFRQVCGLLKFDISSTNISQVMIAGANLAGTATVSAETGVVSDISLGDSAIVVSYAEGNFPLGTYYAAVLPGTTAASCFAVSFVESTGLAHSRAASGDVTIARRSGLAIGGFDESWPISRHIFNQSQLFAWGDAMGSEDNMSVYLDADIDCQGSNWSGAGSSFNGTFDGRNHKIYNLVVESATQTGFIGSLTGTLNNLTFGSSDGSSWDNVTRITHSGMEGNIEYVGLVSRLAGDGNIKNVNNYAKVEVPSSSSSRAYVGGLVGVIPASATGAVISNAKNYGSVSNSSSWTGDQTRMGGVVGQCDGALSASWLENHGNLTVNNSVINFVGGLCGDLGSGSSVSASSNYGTITFSGGGSQMTYLGGCFGSVRGSTISGCHNYAPITATRDAQHRFGGILGLLQSGSIIVDGCVNHAGAGLTVDSSVSSRVVLGGIAGACLNGTDNAVTVTIQSCRNEAEITSNGAASEIGGIVGMLDSGYAGEVHSLRVLDCENTGAVSSTVVDNTYSGLGRELRIGGIIGSSDADKGLCKVVTRSCINRGAVSIAGLLASAKSARVGGIAGLAWYDSLIDNCTNFGEVTCNAPGTGGNVYLGGILGFMEARTSSRYQRIKDCINTGEISSVRNSGSQYIGGILGSVNNAGTDFSPIVSGCKNFASVSATKTTTTLVGGLCGYAKNTVSDCANFGNVSGGSFNGAIVGDGNAAAIMTVGLKVGADVEVTGAANPGIKYTEGKKEYVFPGGANDSKRWFSGDARSAPLTVTVGDQETYQGGSVTPVETRGYLFIHTGDGDGYYYRMYYAISHDGLSWTELNDGNSPMVSYYGFPYVTQDSEGTFWLIGVSNNTPRHPVIWKSKDMVSWTVFKNIPASVMDLPAGYMNDTNSFGAMKIFFDPVSEQFMITWHAGETDKKGDAYWESMRTFYVLTSDFETFTPAQKLFAFTGSDANMAQIDVTIHYYNNRYYALIKDERTYNSSKNYYKRPRIAVSNSLTGGYANPGGALTPKNREGMTMVKSPDNSCWYLYVENYDSNPRAYELYRSTSLTTSGWNKVSGFTPPTTQSVCRHGCVVPIDGTVYSRLEAVYGN